MFICLLQNLENTQNNYLMVTNERPRNERGDLGEFKELMIRYIFQFSQYKDPFLSFGFIISTNTYLPRKWLINDSVPDTQGTDTENYYKLNFTKRLI